ncbi:hypothetical protein GCM10010458_05250 [Microbacterium luteolum]
MAPHIEPVRADRERRETQGKLQAGALHVQPDGSKHSPESTFSSKLGRLRGRSVCGVDPAGMPQTDQTPRWHPAFNTLPVAAAATYCAIDTCTRIVGPRLGRQVAQLNPGRMPRGSGDLAGEDSGLVEPDADVDRRHAVRRCEPSNVAVHRLVVHAPDTYRERIDVDTCHAIERGFAHADAASKSRAARGPEAGLRECPP